MDRERARTIRRIHSRGVSAVTIVRLGGVTEAEVEAALALSEEDATETPESILREALERIEKFGHGYGHGRGYTCANIAEEALKRASEISTHLGHCHQGEYEGSCKYGADDCPAGAR